jgi:uncharacterized protein YlxW (UPF0749 family)
MKKERIKGIQIVGFALFALFGILLAAQLKSIYQSNADNEKYRVDTGAYTIQLKDEKAKGEQYQQELLLLEREKNQLVAEKAFTPLQYTLRMELQQISFKAGLTDVKGDGIVITMNDIGIDSASIIHDMHIVETVNALKIAGAQAISVNGQRIMPFSEQVCAGLKIRINKFRYSVPYVITAIGNPDKLLAGVSNSIVMITLKAKKINIEIVKKNDLIIPKYFGDLINVTSGLEAAL